MAINKKGFFIVIDGTDGAGKHTQTQLLVEHLRDDHFPALATGFPQYDTPTGKAVRSYLKGEMGEVAIDVSAREASLLYAKDRLANSGPIKEALEEGKVVVSDRYTTANMGHQGGKFTDPVKKLEFFEWLRNLEFDEYKIPKPDFTILLHVPTDISQKLIIDDKKRGQEKDIHESDLEHLRAAEQTFLELPALYPNEMIVLECVKDGELMSIDEIHDLIWEKVFALLTAQ